MNEVEILPFVNAIIREHININLYNLTPATYTVPSRRIPTLLMLRLRVIVSHHCSTKVSM